MASERQIAANRQNAKYSTGPKTEHGKRRARKNAVRHGLTAETVIHVLEDPRAYRALQRSILADYRPHSNFELQLVGRLVSLLWRLRRATAIESGMLAMDAAHRDRKAARDKIIEQERLNQFNELIPTIAPRMNFEHEIKIIDQKTGTSKKSDHEENNFKIAKSFMRSSRINGNVIECLGRYEVRLWRQALQTILLLNALHADSHANGQSVHTFFSYCGRRVNGHRHIRWPPFGLPKVVPP